MEARRDYRDRLSKIIKLNNGHEEFIIVKNIKKRYANGFQALNGVSFYIEKGKTLGLVGESGSGKSTLARCLLMLERFQEGEVWFNKVPLHALKKKDLRKEQQKMQIIFQNPNMALNNKLKIIDSLMEPLDCRPELEPPFLKEVRHDRRKTAERLIEMMAMPSRYLDCYPHELSGGMKQRITIARAISVNPELILLDEPTSSLDVSIQARILNLLKDLQEELKLTYFFISHDLSAVNFMSDWMLVMFKGEVVDCSNRNELFSDDRHSYTKNLLAVFDISRKDSQIDKKFEISQ